MSISKQPNWRWLRAIDLVDDQGRPSRKDGEQVVRAWRFLRRKRAANSTRMRSLETDYPDIFEADKLYEEAIKMRWHLEALICTEAPHETIHKDHGYSLEVIRAYEALFFDVRDKLFSAPYVETYILDPALQNRSLDEESPDFLPKMVALVMGYDGLMDFRRKGHESAELTRFRKVERESKSQWKALEASYVAPVNKYNAVDFLNYCAQIDATDRERGRGADEALLGAVHSLLQSVAFKRRSADDKLLAPDGSEPRALADSDLGFDRESEDSTTGSTI